MIGVICPSRFEAEALDHRALRRKAVLVVSGMGKVRAIDACARLAATVRRLQGLLLIGFAGGLTADLAVGDVIEPNTFIEYDYDARPLEPFPNIVRRRRASRLLKGSRAATMLTQDRFLTANPFRGSPEEARYRTLACDMESYAVAYFCEQRRLRYGVVKLISDVADADADHDFLAACKRLAPELNRCALAAVQRLRGDA